jgi:hypothetical protein
LIAQIETNFKGSILKKRTGTREQCVKIIKSDKEKNTGTTKKRGQSIMMLASPGDHEIKQTLLWGVQMIHGAVFSKKAPLAAGGIN